MTIKKEVMKEAWRLYRTVVRLFHLSHRARLAEAMKMAWKNIKFKIKNGYGVCKSKNTTEDVTKPSEPEKVMVYVVPEWLMYEKALFGVRSNIIKESEIEKETVKAFRMYGEWFPKSQCERKEI